MPTLGIGFPESREGFKVVGLWSIHSQHWEDNAQLKGEEGICYKENC